MSKVDFKDLNNNLLATSVLPDGFVTEASVNVVKQELDDVTKIDLKAVKDGCSIHVINGGSYAINKMPQPEIYYYMQPANQNTGPKELTTIQYDLDETASGILKKKVEKGTYFDLSDKLREKLYPELQRYVRTVTDNIYLGSAASPIPIGGVLRNYLLDGGLGWYETDQQYLGLFIYRLGVEADLLSNYQGISENLSDKPFAKADITMNTINSVASVSFPLIFYMLSDKKEDLKVFMTFVDEFALSKQLLDYDEQLYQANLQRTFQQARMATMQNQAIIDMTWQNLNQQFASMDRLSNQLSRDMDEWRNSQNQMRAQSDMRFNTSSAGESLDDKIQRMRHESMMGVETYERSDGTTVEFDSRADRVFENNLDSTQHFGTEHYYGDYIPDGWHEMKKK